ncbi:MAG: LysM peptidoglycan-binding domain-containing protein [Bacteroidia bacterium]|nr:LysM peptidoglycan-binding domain-containing protein [Bacteroidia bacterium]MDW8088705.1 LysM peptidoglycan-binding domain-containing protein [Bacteroidia bacterium]
MSLNRSWPIYLFLSGALAQDSLGQSTLNDSSYPFIRLAENRLLFARYLERLWIKLHQRQAPVRILHITDQLEAVSQVPHAVAQALAQKGLQGNGGFIFPYVLFGWRNAGNFITLARGPWLVGKVGERMGSPLPCTATGIGGAPQDPTADWEIRWPPHAAALSAGSQLQIFVRALEPNLVAQVVINDTLRLRQPLPNGLALLSFSLPCPLYAIKGSFPNASPGSIELHGVFLEAKNATLHWHTLAVENLRLRDWFSLPLWQESLQRLAPDLLIVDLGRQDLYETADRSDSLETLLPLYMERLREALPGADVLWVVPQEFYWRLRPVASLERWRLQLIRFAYQKGQAVWDSYTSLGSMRNWRLWGLAEADLYRLSPKGLRVKAQMLLEALWRSYEGFVADSLPEPASDYAQLRPGEVMFAVSLTPSLALVAPPASPSLSSPSATTTAQPYKVHRVRPGETLLLIAQRYGVSLQVLMSANNLANERIYVGQMLRIPSVGSEPSPMRKARWHVVQPGESLWQIARRYGTSVGTLCQLNGLSSRASLRPGQKLRLP